MQKIKNLAQLLMKEGKKAKLLNTKKKDFEVHQSF